MSEDKYKIDTGNQQGSKGQSFQSTEFRDGLTRDDGLSWRGSVLKRRWFKTISVLTIFFFMWTLIDWRFMSNTAYAQEAQPVEEQDENQQPAKSPDDQSPDQVPHLPEQFQPDITGPNSPLNEIDDEAPDSDMLEARTEFADEVIEDEDGDLYFIFKDEETGETTEVIVTNAFGNVIEYTQYERNDQGTTEVTWWYDEDNGNWNGSIMYRTVDTEGNSLTIEENQDGDVAYYEKIEREGDLTTITTWDINSGDTVTDTENNDAEVIERKIEKADGTVIEYRGLSEGEEIEFDDNGNVINGVEKRDNEFEYVYEDGEITEVHRPDGSVVRADDDFGFELDQDGNVISGVVTYEDGTVEIFLAGEVIDLGVLADQVKADLGSRFGVDPSDITLGEFDITTQGFSVTVTIGGNNFTYTVVDTLSTLNDIPLTSLQDSFNEMGTLLDPSQGQLQLTGIVLNATGYQISIGINGNDYSYEKIGTDSFLNQVPVSQLQTAKDDLISIFGSSVLLDFTSLTKTLDGFAISVMTNGKNRSYQLLNSEGLINGAKTAVLKESLQTMAGLFNVPLNDALLSNVELVKTDPGHMLKLTLGGKKYGLYVLGDKVELYGRDFATVVQSLTELAVKFGVPLKDLTVLNVTRKDTDIEFNIELSGAKFLYRLSDTTQFLNELDLEDIGSLVEVLEAAQKLVLLFGEVANRFILTGVDVNDGISTTVRTELDSASLRFEFPVGGGSSFKRF